MTMKKKLLTTLSVVLILGLAALGILAYLTDTDSAVNVMTTGEVDIEQTEDFVQDTPLYPGTEVDKVVKVTNKGPSDCYTRTLVAFQVIGDKDAPLYSYEYDLADGYSVIDNDVFIKVGDVTYEVIEFLHNEKLVENQEVTSLTKVGMSSAATNDDMTDKYKVLVLSQAVQAAGFGSAEEALNAGFGNVTATMAKIWFEDPTKKVVKVTPNNAQQVLDEIGSGMTIEFTPGEYGMLYFRQSEASEIVEGYDYAQGTYDETKMRTYSNLTIKGGEDVNVEGFATEAGTYYNTKHSNSAKYPVLESFIVMKNVKIDGFNFTGTADAFSFVGKNSIDGLTISNCHMPQNASHNWAYQFVNVDADKSSVDNVNGETFVVKFANVTIDNCSAEFVDRFILAKCSENLTVTNNTASNVDQHFINLQSGLTDHTGVITITGNSYTNGSERFLRAAYLANAHLVLERNKVNNAFFDETPADDELDLVKVNVRAGSAFTFTNYDNQISTSANTGATFDPTVVQ